MKNENNETEIHSAQTNDILISENLFWDIISMR